MDIAKAINEDILEVAALGVDFIQLDEFTWPYGFEDWAIEAFNRSVEGVKNAKIVCHICWGNWGGTPAYLPDQTAQPGEIFDLTQRKGPTQGDSTFVIPKAYEAKMDVLNLEVGGRRRDLSGLEVLKRCRRVEPGGQPVVHGERRQAVLGQVVSGQDVVDRISQSDRDARDKPLEPVVIESVEIR